MIYTIQKNSDDLVVSITSEDGKVLTFEKELTIGELTYLLKPCEFLKDGTLKTFNNGGTGTSGGLELENGKLIFKDSEIKYFNLKSTFSLLLTFNKKVINSSNTSEFFDIAETFTFTNSLTYFFRTNTTSTTNMNNTHLSSLDIFYFLVNTGIKGDRTGRNLGITFKVENFIVTKAWSRDLPVNWNTNQTGNETLLPPSDSSEYTGEVVSADWKNLFTKTFEAVTFTGTASDLSEEL